MLKKLVLLLLILNFFVFYEAYGQGEKDSLQDKGDIKMFKEIKVLFISGIGLIVQDDTLSQELYIETLGLPMKKEENNYCHTKELAGADYFVLWPLSLVAESCFGNKSWPKDIPIPQSALELEVEDITAATKIMKDKGYKLLLSEHKEPWGQIVTRLLSPEGILLGLTYTPWLRIEDKK